MCGQEAFCLPRLGGGEGRLTCLRVWLPVEQDVQNDIHIEQDFAHRYLTTRCFLYVSWLAFRRDPRRERKIGVSRGAADGLATAARYASTISETDTPKHRDQRAS